MTNRSIFIGATGQNVGKTTLCLGLISALRKRFSSLGFIKPVGQQHLKVDGGINVDKDAVLFKQHFEMTSDWKDMSPVIIPSGFTRDFLDGKISESTMLDQIQTSYKKISQAHDYTVVEGTGHVGVGSIINLNNAKVASALGLDIVLIASGGLGSTIDELALNITMCHHHKVKVRGVILNKVLSDKSDMLKEYIPKALKRWDIPLIGCVPYDPYLSSPTMKDFESLFNTALISGEQHRYRHFTSVRFFAGSAEDYRKEMKENELVITLANREDIILETLQKHLQTRQSSGTDFRGGMILTGRQPPSASIEKQIQQGEIPILYAPMTSYDAMKKITSFIAKISIQDILKIEKAISVVENHVDFDALCQRL
jgi:phosphate acetyltransferase